MNALIYIRIELRFHLFGTSNSGWFHVCRCYCILHDDNVLGTIFSTWKELRTAKSWEEVEMTVWGELNNYKGYV